MYSSTLSLNSAALDGMGGQRHDPAALHRKRPSTHCVVVVVVVVAAEEIKIIIIIL